MKYTKKDNTVPTMFLSNAQQLFVHCQKTGDKKQQKTCWLFIEQYAIFLVHDELPPSSKIDTSVNTDLSFSLSTSIPFHVTKVKENTEDISDCDSNTETDGSKRE